ncbi:hypothetical protein SAY60_002906 [Salmonella enterica]|nr:hypothetical protein [Salmonella enterica]
MVCLRVNVNGNQRWVDAAQVAVFVDSQPAIAEAHVDACVYGNGFVVVCALFKRFKLLIVHTHCPLYAALSACIAAHQNDSGDTSPSL